MTPDEASFYASHSPESDPADLRELVDALPGDAQPILDAVAGLILDTAFVPSLGIVCPPETADDVEVRRLPEMLGRIVARSPGSLATARPDTTACPPGSESALRPDVRAGRSGPAKCGVWSIGIAGAWFVAGSVVRDLAAPNKREMLPWDYWGISRDLRPGSAVSEAVAARIDTLAALIADPEPDWPGMREVYERDEALRVPSVVRSFPRGRPTDVEVGA